MNRTKLAIAYVLYGLISGGFSKFSILQISQARGNQFFDFSSFFNSIFSSSSFKMGWVFCNLLFIVATSPIILSLVVLMGKFLANIS